MGRTWGVYLPEHVCDKLELEVVRREKFDKVEGCDSVPRLAAACIKYVVAKGLVGEVGNGEC